MIDTVTKSYYEGNFTMYKITYIGSDKEFFVPLDEANKDYQAIQEWSTIEGNNIIDPGA